MREHTQMRLLSSDFGELRLPVKRVSNQLQIRKVGVRCQLKFGRFTALAWLLSESSRKKESHSERSEESRRNSPRLHRHHLLDSSLVAAALTDTRMTLRQAGYSSRSFGLSGVITRAAFKPAFASPQGLSASSCAAERSAGTDIPPAPAGAAMPECPRRSAV